MIGIIGGMGPKAGLDLYNEIISITPALDDQDHIPAVLLSDPTIPSRTNYILEGDISPLPKLVAAAKSLQKIGADYIVLGCNAAHLFAHEIQRQVHIPVINMLYETSKYVQTNYSYATKVGLLATTATIKSGLYHKYFEDKQIEVLTPDKTIQEENVMQSVKNVKMGFIDHPTKKLIEKAFNSLVEKGAEVIILGCTELPLLLHDKEMKVPAVNATRILATKAVEYSLSQNCYDDELKVSHKQMLFSGTAI
ncbi:MAG: aspartate racemase [Candidatus Dojkabacteria bacterium]